MSIIKKVKLVGAVLKQARSDVYKFKIKSGLKCVENCGKCCEKKDISATPLEFLPLAYFLYKTKQAEKCLEILNQKPSSQICVFYNTEVFFDAPVKPKEIHIIKINKLSTAVSGNCSVYSQRGLLCGLFGFTATRGKAGVNIVSCLKIKEGFPEEYALTRKKIIMGMRVPFMNDYYTRLSAIDGYLGVKYYPINTAVKTAVEYVLSYMDWHGGENCA